MLYPAGGWCTTVSAHGEVFDCVSVTKHSAQNVPPLHSTSLLGVLPAYLIVVTEIEQSSSLCIYTSLSILLYSSGSCNAR